MRDVLKGTMTLQGCTEILAVYVPFLVTSQDPVLRHHVMLTSYRAEQRGLSDPMSSFCGSSVHTAGNLGDEQHLVFELELGHRYNGQFGDHAATTVLLMRQHHDDTRAVAQSITECMDAHGDLGPQSQASNEP